jgi:hypothetical protein
MFEQARLQIPPRCRALGGRAAVVVQGCEQRQLACLRQLRATRGRGGGGGGVGANRAQDGRRRLAIDATKPEKPEPRLEALVAPRYPRETPDSRQLRLPGAYRGL